MAVANGSSSAMVKAVLLPLILVLLAMAAGASSTEDGPAVAESGGRFSETPVGRKLLTLSLCGSGTAPDYSCKKLFPSFANASCCPILLSQSCVDIGSSLKCGSCTGPTCKVLESCCSGVCTNVWNNDKNNCGKCGNKCKGTCTKGFCNY